MNYGMNALYALALGRIVFSGAEDFSLAHLNGSTPVINLRPDIDYNIAQIESLLSQPLDKLHSLQNNSHKFLFEHHDSSLIANQYIHLWTQPSAF